jgi:Mg/Co/Ni transporter MgtE
VLDSVTKGYLTLRPASAAQTLVRLDDQDIRAVFQAMPTQLAVKVLEHMAPGSAARCLQLLPRKNIAGILAHTPVQVALASLRLMNSKHVSEILNYMSSARAANLRMRLRYAKMVIGAFIDSDVVTFNADLRVGDALRLFRREGRRTGNSVHVLNEYQHVVGLVHLSDLLGSRDRIPLRYIMHPAPVILQARAAIQSVRDHPAWRDYDSLPVVNRNDVFQGVLRRAKVMVNELQESIDVKEQNDIASTSSALADIFWTVLGSIFVMGPPTSGKRTDDRT